MTMRVRMALIMVLVISSLSTMITISDGNNKYGAVYGVGGLTLYTQCVQTYAMMMSPMDAKLGCMGFAIYDDPQIIQAICGNDPSCLNAFANTFDPLGLVNKLPMQTKQQIIAYLDQITGMY